MTQNNQVFKITKSGVVITTTGLRKIVGAKCDFCPEIIFKKNEVGGVIKTVDGKRVCARCRIMKFGSKDIAKQIEKSKAEHEAEMKRREDEEQEKANEQMREFALKTQLAHPEVKKFK